MKMMSIEDLQDRLSNAVLATLDKEVKELLDNPEARGWIDKELPMLFRGLHPHVKAIAHRINDCGEAGSARLKIEMGAAVETQWQRLQAVGQIHVGDRIRCKVGDRKIQERVALVLNPGTKLEEVVYDRSNNFYFITEMVLEGTSTHKGVEFCPSSV